MDRESSIPPAGRPAITPARGKRRVLRDADQVTIMSLVVICFAAFFVHGCYRYLIGRQTIEFDEAAPLEIDLVIDINSAEWPELTLLPGVGETRAQHIIDYRTQHGPFRSVDELLNVTGIGPKTLDRLRRYVTAREPAGPGEEK
jgi:comEA protein